jgi:hypothetical protein
MTSPLRRSATGLSFPAFALFCASLAAAPAPAQTARTQERDLFVSVIDQSGAPVANLDAQAFVVREDGLSREVLRVRRATDPIDLAILVDNSQATSNAILDLRRGLDAFVTRMKDHGHLAVITVADRPTIALDYTNDGAALQKAVGRIFAIQGSGATFLEGVDETLKGLKKREAERAGILVVWLGGREFSGLGHLNLIKDLRDGHAALHVLTVGSGVPADSNTQEGRDREVLFDQGTRGSGGWRRNILSPMGIGDALDALATEVTSQYRVTYARPETLIPPDKVEVSVRPAGLTARGTPARVVRKGQPGS